MKNIIKNSKVYILLLIYIILYNKQKNYQEMEKHEALQNQIQQLRIRNIKREIRCRTIPQRKRP